MPEKIEFALITITGEVSAYHFEEVTPERRNKDEISKILLNGIQNTLLNANSRVLGIGIAVGGMVDPDEGVIIAMNLAPSMAGFEIKRELNDKFGIEVVIDHHPRAILVGERWFGVGRGLNKFAVIYAGNVLGCAMYQDGAPFRGPQGSGGELGHTIVDVDGEECTCGRRGCWETIATLSWLRSRACTLGLPDWENLDTEKLVVASEHDDKAHELLREYAHNLAIGISNLQTLMMPDTFIIYGDARRGRLKMENLLKESVYAISGSQAGSDVTVLTGRDEQQITMRGAAALIVSRQLEVNY
jgi:predicted NBD/HSP70 family sugar kinase